MTEDDLLFYPLSNGAPSNDTDPIGGTLDDGGGEWDEATNKLFQTLKVDAAGGSANTYYGAGTLAIATGASGTLEDPAAYNRAGAKLNSAAGVISLQSTSALDVGDVKANGKVSGIWSNETAACTGLSLSTGLTTFDISSVYTWEYLNDGSPEKPVGDVSCYVDGELCAVIYGTGSPASADIGKGNNQANALYQIAPATAKNSPITWSSTNNRLTAPDGNVEAFENAYLFPGDDQSTALSADLEADDEHQVAFKAVLPAGLPEAVSGVWIVDPALKGYPA